MSAQRGKFNAIVREFPVLDSDRLELQIIVPSLRYLALASKDAGEISTDS